jgi:electron transfer flavoprotein alpha subunit
MNFIYVIANQFGGNICDNTLAAITAASSFSKPIKLIVMDNVTADSLQVMQRCELLDEIIQLEHPKLEHLLPEFVAAACSDLIKDNAYAVIMIANTYSKNMLPRLAASIDCDMISNVNNISEAGAVLTHAIYAGNIFETLQIDEFPCAITVNANSFPKASYSESDKCSVVKITDLALPDIKVEHVALQSSDLDKPLLSNAKVVIAGGRALGSAENFARLEDFAARVGAAVGATRAAVDAGYVPNSYQVGQTGQVVGPDLYIAFGISGAIQHLTGMRDSKVIVAINTDPDAEIFKVADYGLIMDWEVVLAALESAVAG